MSKQKIIKRHTKYKVNVHKIEMALRYRQENLERRERIKQGKLW